MMVTTQVCDRHDHVELFFSFLLFLASDIARCRSYPLEIVMLCSTDLVHAFLFFGLVLFHLDCQDGSISEQCDKASKKRFLLTLVGFRVVTEFSC